MTVQMKFKFIGFSRMTDLLEFPLPDKLRVITYVANCTNFRRLLLNQYGRPDINIDQEISSNPDTKLTYLGYRKFLESDLRHIFTLSENRGSNAYKRDVKYLAKQMLLRGYVRPWPLFVRFLWQRLQLTSQLGLCWRYQTCVSQPSAALHS
jgi:pyoverdine/dityrosine biosynthesis protein Dit1